MWVFEKDLQAHIPQSFLKRFVEGRPWWGPPAVEGMYVGITRSDGRKVSVLNGYPNNVDTSLREKAIELDATNPLHVPCVRPGQIWLVNAPQTVFQVGPINTSELQLAVLDYLASKSSGVMHAYINGMFKCLREHKFYTVPEVSAEDKIALIHDPIRPENVPWTGVLSDLHEYVI
jgi:hypothetical protein